jgi:hypothetical protein
MDVFVADSIEFLMWLKNLGLIVCGSSLVMLTDKQKLTEYINLKGTQNVGPCEVFLFHCFILLQSSHND